MEKVKKVTSEVTLQLLLLCKACSVMHQLNTACYHFLKLSFNLSDKRPCVCLSQMGDKQISQYSTRLYKLP